MLKNMKSIIKISLVVLVTITTLVGGQNFGSSNQAEAMQLRQALMTIRFNQQQVTYKRQLYSVLVEAVKKKPSVVFDVIGYVPSVRDPQRNQKLYENTQIYANEVARNIIEMGVSPQQVTVSTQAGGNIDNEEVRIFVR